jgi:hypothetical protein
MLDDCFVALHDYAPGCELSAGIGILTGGWKILTGFCGRVRMSGRLAWSRGSTSATVLARHQETPGS